MYLKKILCFAAALLICVSALASCGGDSPGFPVPETEEREETVSTEAPEETTDDGEHTHIIKNGKKYFRIVYPHGAGSELMTAISGMQNAVAAVTGESLVLKSDAEEVPGGVSSATREILVGRTNREDSVLAWNSLETLTFRVEVTEHNIVIVGYNEKTTALAVEWFVDNCIEDNISNMGEGYWRIDNGVCYLSPAAPFVFGNFVDGEAELKTEASKLANVPFAEEGEVLQGGCTDGKYYYYAAQRQEGCVIYKVDAESGETVQTSSLIKGTLATDMTFNSKSNVIVAVDSTDKRTTVSVINATNLLIVGRYDMGQSISRIAYVEKDDIYAVMTEEQNLILVFSTSFALTDRIALEGENCRGFDADADHFYVYTLNEGAATVKIYSRSGRYIDEVELGGPESGAKSLIALDSSFVLAYDTYFKGADVYVFEVKIAD